MNEKIAELKRQATIKIQSHGAFGEPESRQQLDVDKFAELIVRECINQVELTWMNQNGWSRNAACVQSIKDYFEVK